MSLSRRKFVGRGVAVGAACWVAPTIVSVPVAWANPPHSVPPRSTKPPKETVSQPQMGGPLPAGLPSQLAFTGAVQDKELAVGAAALVAGAAVVAATHKPKRETFS